MATEEFTRYDRKAEYILRAAAQIFAEKGYHQTSMRDIARATGVSLAGLYYYCKSKDELLFLIQDHCFGRLAERVAERLRETSAPVEKLRVFIENHLSFFAANMAEMKVLSHEADSLKGELYERVTVTKQSYTQLARAILTEVQATLPEEKRAVDATVAAYALFGMMNWIYNWYDPNGKLDVKALVENLTRLFLSGFANGQIFDEQHFAASPQKTDSVRLWRGATTLETK
jgi:AcrR family transcriptional regulator